MSEPHHVTQLDALSRPLRLRGVTLPNRLFMSAMTLQYGADGLISDRHLAFYRERAREEVGLLFSEQMWAVPDELGWRGGNTPVVLALGTAIELVSGSVATFGRRTVVLDSSGIYAPPGLADALSACGIDVTPVAESANLSTDFVVRRNRGRMTASMH
jgi:hypothetical protein